ncbi:hypothetical protein [Xenorhabdus lircayensis]|uniref:hypothetical protein n=1 Tax=Xenorhabdus lircayensis TaxID=2763499 RepID=UPI001E5FACE1|nr:hypothetical protein [Xenorhabdus lircayensis]
MKLSIIIITASILVTPFVSLHAKTNEKVIDCKELDGKSGQNGKDGILNSNCKNGGKGGGGVLPGQSGGNGGDGANEQMVQMAETERRAMMEAVLAPIKKVVLKNNQIKKVIA